MTTTLQKSHDKPCYKVPSRVIIVTVGNKIETHPKQRKLTAEQEQEVVALFQKGIKRELLAVQFGVHFNTIGNVLRRHEEKNPAL